MYLKRIETMGFKSFADKTIVNFENGVTGVVGPNGSGKSNVVDAVRWVLGEQSIKQLRGATTMTDVIFTGSRSRKAHNYAYVTLVLDNEDRHLNIDYKEVEVTRKVFRSGESEYYLNGSKCRLKDISDLILDTGLGKDSFNIISQDKVQSLLNSKPEERRHIFEEAAGVLKYRKRKESAERKLSSTDDNLNRVNDIINELEMQVEPLRIQSENAKKFLEYKNLLEDIEIALLAHEIYEANSEYKELNKQIEIINESIVVDSNLEVKQDKLITEAKNELQVLYDKLDNLNERKLQITRNLDHEKSNKRVFEERIKFSGEQDILVTNKRNLMDEEIVLQNRLNNIKESMEEVDNQKNDLKNKVETISLKYDDYSTRKKQLREYYVSLESKLLDLNSKVNAYEKNNEHKLFDGVKSVVNNPNINGVVDIVANVIDVPDKFINAIDLSLAARSQYVIIDTKANAKRAIDYLNQNKRGRATFLPLDNLNVNRKNINFESHPSIYGFASDLVKVDDMYKIAVDAVIGNVIIAEDLECATKFFETEKGFQIITLNGEIINPRGSITGGTINRKSGILQARFEYEECKSEIVKIENDLENVLSDERSISSELNVIEEEMYKIRTDYAQINEIHSLKQQGFDELNNKLLDVKKELNSMESIILSQEATEELRIANVIKDLQDDLSTLAVEINNENFKRANLQIELEELENSYRAITKKLREDKKQLNEIEIKVNRLDVKVDNYLDRLSEEYSLTFENAFENYQLSLDATEAKSQVKILKSKITALGYVNVNAIEEYEVVNERYTFLNDQKNDIIEAKNELLSTIAELDNVMVKQFKETFDEVAKQYSEMFVKLFGGGKASLSLVDEDDLLNSGVEIEVQPPGKRLQHLSLLSGGEKSLSTLVLLFAILKVRPVPFCILDEVEAALDEANLARFSHFLAEFSSSIQFIIITHRKVTMENADVLYGVTMQESGVSKLVSVKLNEIDHIVEGAN